MERALKKDVILVPGKAFMCDPSTPCQYMRAAFSVVTPEKMDRVSFFFFVFIRCDGDLIIFIVCSQAHTVTGLMEL